MSSPSYPHLLSPGRIGTLESRNRIIVTAMGVSLAEEDGSVGDQLVSYHEEQARGGVGLIITGVAGVAWPVGGVKRQQTAISDDRFLPGLTRLCEAVHAHGAKIAAQLHHGGLMAGYGANRWGHPLWGPATPPAPKGSFVDYFLMEELAGLAGMKPPSIKVMEQADIDLVIAQFRQAARRAKTAGFDGIELHAAHGYLLSSFISPATNTRTDSYGGPIENRLRLVCEIIAAIRQEVGRDFPLWIKLDSREIGKTGGITIEDCVAAAKIVEAAGVDAITASTYHDPSQGKLHSQSHTPQIESANVEASAQIRRSVSIPVIASGRIEPEAGDAIIGQGQVDFIAMGRKLLADPHLPAKLAAQRRPDVRPCVYCYTCISAIYVGQQVRCAVNPDLAQEFRHQPPATASRHVVVIGGGPAGMEATRRLAACGHQVTLIEQSDRLGGTVRFASLAYEPNERLLDWLSRQVERSGARVLLRTKATPDLVAALAPDEVVVATGARRTMPDIAGGELPHVFSGDQMRNLMFGDTSGAMRQKTSLLTRIATKVGAATGASANLDFVRKATHAWMPLGKRVTIIGGELVGLELAEFLHERGRHVEVIEEAPRMGKGMVLVRRMRVLQELAEHGVGLHSAASEIAISAEAVSFRDREGQLHQLPSDTVIVAKGATGDHSVAQALREAGFGVRVIGDANGVGYIEGAMREAAEAVHAINAGTPPEG